MPQTFLSRMTVSDALWWNLSWASANNFRKIDFSPLTCSLQGDVFFPYAAAKTLFSTPESAHSGHPIIGPSWGHEAPMSKKLPRLCNETLHPNSIFCAFLAFEIHDTSGALRLYNLSLSFLSRKFSGLAIKKVFYLVCFPLISLITRQKFLIFLCSSFSCLACA